MDSTFLRTGVVLAILAFLTTFVESLVIAAFIKNKTFSVIAGIVVLLTSLAVIFLAFFKNEDRNKRWVFVFSGAFGVLSAILMLSLKLHFHNTETLQKAVVYALIAIGLSSLLSLCWVYATEFALKNVLDTLAIEQSQQRILFMTVNLIQALLVGVMFALGKYRYYAFKRGFAYSIIIMFLNAAIFFGLSYYITVAKSDETVAKYDSVPSYEGIN